MDDGSAIPLSWESSLTLDPKVRAIPLSVSPGWTMYVGSLGLRSGRQSQPGERK